MVKVSDEFTLMIDYAHNAMALESLLTTLREYHPHRLVCLFGCGGNRSRLRRYEMGEVSGRLADLTIITSDIIREMRSPRLLLMTSKWAWRRQKVNMWRFQTARKQSLMPSITENQGILWCWLVKGMKIIRKSKVKKISYG